MLISLLFNNYCKGRPAYVYSYWLKGSNYCITGASSGSKFCCVDYVYLYWQYLNASYLSNLTWPHSRPNIQYFNPWLGLHMTVLLLHAQIHMRTCYAIIR